MEPTGKERDDTLAPDFALVNSRGQPVRLSDFRGRRYVVLVFARGFL
jgi:peroxiredoxin